MGIGDASGVRTEDGAREPPGGPRPAAPGSLRRNAAWMFALQGASSLFPLVTLPWLTRVLGPEGYGRIGFAAAVSAYFVLLADYGFNLSATRQVAVHRDDRAARSRIFGATIVTKACLAVAGLVLLLVLTAAVPRLRREGVLLLVGYVGVVGSVLTPVWFFQGIEQMRALAVANIVARAVALPAIFLLVRSPSDTVLAMALTSGTSLVAGLVSLGILRGLRQVDWVPPSPADVVAALRDGWHVFLSTAAISLYTVSSTVLLGFVAGDAVVGWFTGAQRIAGAVQLMVSPLSQAVYPRISYLMHHARDDAFAFVRKVLWAQGAATLLLSLALLAAAPVVVALILGPGYTEAVAAVRWMAFLPFLIGLSNVFGIQTMLPLGMSSAFSRILLAAGLLHVVAILPLGRAFGAAGAAGSVLGTELVVTVAMGLYLWYRQAPIFGRPRGGARASPP